MMPTDPLAVCKIVNKLHALGDADHIALFFAQQRVRGVPGLVDSCAVAKYIQRETGHAVSVAPEAIVTFGLIPRGSGCVEWQPGESVALHREGPIVDFMTRFDEGFYPELVA